MLKILYTKGFFGVSKTPQHWPTPYYQKQVGPKPMTCPVCHFVASDSEQIELHHPTYIDSGPKNQRNPEYYRERRLQPMCANCHSLEHRTGDHLYKSCGTWRQRLPGNQKYKNPDNIFSGNCTETYRVQKVYYIKWHLVSPSDYNCQKCGRSRWGREIKLVSLELHHKDHSHKNSLLDNLELLCPNCHRKHH